MKLAAATKLRNTLIGTISKSSGPKMFRWISVSWACCVPSAMLGRGADWECSARRGYLMLKGCVVNQFGSLPVRLYLLNAPA